MSKDYLDNWNHHYSFKQEGIPAHNSKRTHVWLMNNLTEVLEKEIRPPSSPDCITFDYFSGGVSELRVRSDQILQKTRDLISYIWEVMGFLARNTVAKA